MSLPDLQLLIAAALIFVPVERLIPSRPQAVLRPGYVTDLLHFAISGFLIRVGAVAIVGIVSGWVADNMPPYWWESVRLQPAWLQFCELLLLSDFCFYLAHRTVHAVPLLWRLHSIHHSSEHLDWLSTYRVHPLDQIFNSVIIALPSILFGFSPMVMIVYAVGYKWHAMLLHSNTRISLGILDRAVATPHYHHWHHANKPEAYDKNFGGQLVVWDALFGTLYRPADPPTRYGSSDQVELTYLGQILRPLWPACFNRAAKILLGLAT
jgi:sterol desaturase/sphingolipid hydroxylase (fatty acid hydroxylase superfamily)